MGLRSSGGRHRLAGIVVIDNRYIPTGHIATYPISAAGITRSVAGNDQANLSFSPGVKEKRRGPGELGGGSPQLPLFSLLAKRCHAS